jgi:ABC-type lipopolysaccharide export system ATPase subunit
MAAVFFTTAGKLAFVDSAGNVRTAVTELAGNAVVTNLQVTSNCLLQGNLQVTFNSTANVGAVTMNGDAKELLNDPRVRAAYLGE